MTGRRWLALGRRIFVGFAVLNGVLFVLVLGSEYLVRGTMEQAAENCGDGPSDSHFVTRDVTGFPPKSVCRFSADGWVFVVDDSPSAELYLIPAGVLAAGLLLMLQRLLVRRQRPS